MFVARIKKEVKGKKYETVLIQESYRENGKPRHRNIANISKLPPDTISLIEDSLKGNKFISFDKDFTINKSIQHGNVAAIYGTIKRLELDKMISSTKSRKLNLVLAMIMDRIISPKSKLACKRNINNETAVNSINEILNLATVKVKDLYKAMDWLFKRQSAIEKKLAKHHLKNGCLVLYDLTSSYMEGRKCELAKYGYSRDNKRGKLQIEFGLLCTKDGCPVSVTVFEGNTSDSKTLSSQIQKIRKEFGIKNVVLVGDRGMITQKIIDDELSDIDGLDWITALRASSIRKLHEEKSLQLSLFDKQNLAEIYSPTVPNERLIVCKNPFLADERANNREKLLVKTEKELSKIKQAVDRKRNPLTGKDKIALIVGSIINKCKMKKHFNIKITDRRFTYDRNEVSIRNESQYDGYYVIRTTVKADILNTEEVVHAYKGLSKVEQAFKRLKSFDIEVRPIHHRLDERVKSHIFICMLAYYVEWHMIDRLKPLLFSEEEVDMSGNPVMPKDRSARTKMKMSKQRTEDNLPINSFRTLLNDLSTLCKNYITLSLPAQVDYCKYTNASELQQKVFKLLDVNFEKL